MVKLWPTKSRKDIYISHSKGLTAEHITFFKSLALGDKVVVFINEDNTLSFKKAKAMLDDSGTVD